METEGGWRWREGGDGGRVMEGGWRWKEGEDGGRVEMEGVSKGRIEKEGDRDRGSNRGWEGRRVGSWWRKSKV